MLPCLDARGHFIELIASNISVLIRRSMATALTNQYARSGAGAASAVAVHDGWRGGGGGQLSCADAMVAGGGGGAAAAAARLVDGRYVVDPPPFLVPAVPPSAHGAVWLINGVHGHEVANGGAAGAGVAFDGTTDFHQPAGAGSHFESTASPSPSPSPTFIDFLGVGAT
ncbi:hypothetical protein GUJ93_ZPchr0010g7665 [Zizania palustris]|uniref:Uncharacterized protein n=1 Tax=Zizania palustris TaxID=103762 RepID=A0A8J5WER2_ZIZPA|nr:hypothetical protein GUJ93_ZPchr0010g7665 [Zizania palustris]